MDIIGILECILDNSVLSNVKSEADHYIVRLNIQMDSGQIVCKNRTLVDNLQSSAWETNPLSSVNSP